MWSTIGTTMGHETWNKSRCRIKICIEYWIHEATQITIYSRYE
jgi:hypothetical protein